MVIDNSEPTEGAADSAQSEPAVPESHTLRIVNLHSYYGTAHVLHGVDFSAEAGSAVAVLGRNGAGKSTFLKSIAGASEVTRTGSIRIGSTELVGLRADQIARHGVQLVPEDRRVLTSLSVEENLALAARGARLGKKVDYVSRVVNVFPEMESFLTSGGGELSGGQQQMVAVARALVGEPQLLLLDEPSTGLAPVVVDRLLESLVKLRSLGATMLVAEQNVNFALEICEEVVILEKGLPVFRGSRATLQADKSLRESYLEV